MQDDSAVLDIVKAVPKLPVVPAMFQRLRSLLAAPDTDLREIAATVQQDPSISAKVLQLANSVVFRRGMPIANIDAGVMRLGTATISRLVMIESVLATHYPVAKFKFPEEARRYFMASLIAESVVRRQDRDEASLAVLLAPIGRLLMMAASPAKMEKVMAKADSGEKMIVEELRMYGTTHAAVGAHLIRAWGLPPRVADALLMQHDPTRVAETDEVGQAILHANRDIRGVPKELPPTAFAASWDRHKARAAFLEAAA